MNSIKCPKCQLTHWATDELCKRCGWWLHAELPEPPQPSFTASYDQAPAAYQAQNFAKPKMEMAIASMVLGIIGCIPPLGLVLGIIALRKANRRPNEYGGYGFAVAGIVLNSIGVLVMLSFIPIIFAIAIPNVIAAKNAANEGSAIKNIRTIHSAEMTYQATSGAGSYSDIQKLADVGLIQRELGDGLDNEYRFEAAIFSPSISRPASFEIYATPTTKNRDSRSFMMGVDGVLRGAKKNGAKADKSDPVIGENHDYNSVRAN